MFQWSIIGEYLNCYCKRQLQWGMIELVLEPLSLYHLFVLAYIAIYVFRGNPFQDHSLEQSYHPTQPFVLLFFM